MARKHKQQAEGDAKKPSLSRPQIAAAPAKGSPWTAVGRLLLGIALFLSIYLAMVALGGQSVAGCGEGEGCQEVLSSRWSSLLGLPVSLAGSVAYVGMIAVDVRARRSLMWWVFASLIVLGALWFSVLQAAVLRAFCPWCTATHAAAAAGVVMLWVASRAVKTGDVAPGGGAWWKGALAAAGALAATALLQVYGPQKKTTETVTVSGGAVGESLPAPEIGERIVPLHGGSIQVDVRDLPSIGDTGNAAHVVVGLFDFTCPHCRELQGILEGIEESFGGRLAVAELPGAHNEQGRAIHRLMLSLWKERPELRATVEEMLHEGALQADPVQVQRQVEQAMGAEAVAAMIGKWQTWVQGKLALAEQVYQANRSVTQKTKFPQLMVGDAIDVGVQSGAGHYYALFRDKLGLVRDAVPQLAVEPASVDLGTVVAGSPHQLKFTLRNAGKAPARLRKAVLPVGMRWLEGQPEVVEAGKDVELTIGLEAPLQNGPAACEIQLQSDAEPPAIMIPVKAQVRNPIEVRPQQVNFGSFNSQTPPVKVQILLSEPVKLGEPKSSIPQYEAKIEEVEEGKRYELEIKVVGQFAGQGFRQGMIEVPIDGSGFDEPWPEAIRVRAYGRVIRSPGS